MFSFEGTNVKFVPHESLDVAIQKANEAAGRTGGIAIPCVIFRQGRRDMISAAIPFRVVMDRLISESAPDASTIEQVKAARNRPEDGEHSQAIAAYIRENIEGKFILPPMTLNVSEEVQVHSVQYPDSEPPTKNGVMLLPMSAKVDITDGQHRRSGIVQAYRMMRREEQRELDTSSIAVMVTSEPDVAQVHQDFADCSRTKPLASSQLAVYDRRNPANAIVMDMIDMVPLFRDKVDSTSLKLSKKSPAPFLTNQVRQVVKTFLTGGYGMAELDFEAKAKDELKNGSSPEYLERRDRYVEFMRAATDAIPMLKEVSGLAPGLLRTRIPAYRDEGWVCLSATGLNMLARLGHEMLKDNAEDWREHVAKLGDIDWRRSAPLWQGNVVSDDGNRISTAHKAFQAGVHIIKEQIGWAPRVEEEIPDQGEISELNLVTMPATPAQRELVTA